MPTSVSDRPRHSTNRGGCHPFVTTSPPGDNAPGGCDTGALAAFLGYLPSCPPDTLQGGTRDYDQLRPFSQFFGEVTIVVVTVGLLSQPEDLLPHLLRSAVCRFSAAIPVCQSYHPSLALSGYQAAELPFRDVQ